MYINPVLVGVLGTLIVEGIILVAYAIHESKKRK